MFDKNNKRIASKELNWHWIKRGVAVQLHFDLEAGGVDPRDAPHALRGYPVITEYGDALGDIAGNYHGSLQIFPRRPERLMIDAPAPLVQRMMAEDYDSEDRMPYFEAMGRIIWRIEKAAHQYEAFTDREEEIGFKDINLQAKGPKSRIETVFSMPMQLRDGEIVRHVRYHPLHRRLSYRVGEDPSRIFDYENIKNLYYIDELDGSKWRWVEPRTAIMGANIQSYDVPVMRVNEARVGVHPANIPFLYSRATLTSKQNPKNYLVDVRNLSLLAVLHGRQGEDGMKIASKFDPESGRLFSSEALAAYLDVNTRFENVIRGIGGGAFMPHNGSVHDQAADHGAVYDALASFAQRNLCMDTAPEITSLAEEQSDEDNCRRILTAQDYTGKTLPLFSLPRRDYQSPQSDSPYFFLDVDEFKRFGFLLADGTFHKQSFNGKSPHQLTPDEWILFIEKTRHSPDRSVRMEPYRQWRGALHINTVLEKSHAAGRYRDMMPEMDQDAVYIKEHPEMVENIRSAISEMIRRQRFRPGPPNPIMEDEWPRHGFGGIYYQEEAICDERRQMRQANKGPKPVKGILETVRERMQDDANFLNMVDEGLMHLFVTTHPVDFAKGKEEEKEALERFNDLIHRVWKKFEKKKVPYTGLLEHYMGDFFHGGGTSRKSCGFPSVEKARAFRDALRLRALNDYTEEMKDKNSGYAQGFISRDMLFKAKGKPHRLLFANLDRGDSGAAPHVVDGAGRILPTDYITRQDPGEAIRMLKEREWRFRFHRLRSEPIIETVMHIFVDGGRLGKLPPEWRKHYLAREQVRLRTPPNEDVATARFPTIDTFRHQQQRLEINANSRDIRLLERETHTQRGIAARLARQDEGQRIIAGNSRWIDKIDREHPLKPEMMPAMLRDPASGLAYDYIPYEIPANDHVVIDVPAWHLRHPVRQYDTRLPFSCLVLEKPPREDMKRIKAGTPVVAREIETGRLYALGPVSIHDAPARGDQSFALLNENAQHAYRQAGMAFPNDTNRIVLGIEGLYPLANSRPVQATDQTLKVPGLHFDAFTYPEISSFDQPLRTIVTPMDYCPQRLDVGGNTRLREMKARMFENIDGLPAPDTGHIYEAGLRDVIGLKDGRKTGITLRQLFRDAASGRIPEKTVRECGFLGRDHMEARLREWARGRWTDDFMDEKVLVLSFEKVRPSSWAYFNPPEAPMAALTRDGMPVPPSAYQDVRRKM